MAQIKICKKLMVNISLKTRNEPLCFKGLSFRIARFDHTLTTLYGIIKKGAYIQGILLVEMGVDAERDAGVRVADAAADDRQGNAETDKV